MDEARAGFLGAWRGQPVVPSPVTMMRLQSAEAAKSVMVNDPPVRVDTVRFRLEDSVCVVGGDCDEVAVLGDVLVEAWVDAGQQGVVTGGALAELLD